MTHHNDNSVRALNLDELASVTGGFMQSDDAGGPLNDPSKKCTTCSTSPGYGDPSHVPTNDMLSGMPFGDGRKRPAPNMGAGQASSGFEE